LAARLRAAHFRFLNERLYTTSSAESFQHFQANPEHFFLYHEGYREQVAKWPVKPTRLCIELLQQRIRHSIQSWKSSRPPTGPVSTIAPYRIVDMGCGQAVIASTLDSRISNSWSAKNGFQVEVHSFDLAAENEMVTACDVSQGTSLPDACADAVVFCLSLMSPNYGAMLEEGIRLLRLGETRRGLLLIVEIASRFQQPGACRNDHRHERDRIEKTGQNWGWPMEQFSRAVQSRGLRLRRKTLLHNYFVLFEFELSAAKSSVKQPLPPMPALRPCLYKKR
jgi:hypothetical protein